jgi:iron(III) transport system ATP-binding protein
VCKDFKLTTVYVTHDQKEALSISDRMAIMDAGKIKQVGSPRDVYRRPTCQLVANFIGETDFIPGKIVSASSGGVVVETACGRFEGVLGDPVATLPVGAKVTLSVRPECWVLSREAPVRNAVKGKIGEAVYLGEVAQYDFQSCGLSLKILELNPRFIDPAARGEVFASVKTEDVVVLAE